jgi:hypothetical protein
MSEGAAIGPAVMIAAGCGLMFAMASRELVKLFDPRVVMVSGLRVERSWFRRFVQTFFAAGAFVTVLAPLMLLLGSSNEFGPARWFFLGTLIFDAFWLAGLVKHVRSDNIP